MRRNPQVYHNSLPCHLITLFHATSRAVNLNAHYATAFHYVQCSNSILNSLVFYLFHLAKYKNTCRKLPKETDKEI
jgi:hypothetical protein